MPYVPSKKTDGKSTDRELIDVQVEALSRLIVDQVQSNSDLLKLYKQYFIEIGQLLEKPINKSFDIVTSFAETVFEVAKKYNYEGAFLGELNYAITRVIQRVPKLLAENNKCGLVKGKELRYWLYAMTVSALTYASNKLIDSNIGINGVFEDIKDEYKVRVNKSYEILQILKSGDCYDTPYFNKVVEITDETGKVIGYTYIELVNDGKNVKLDKMPYTIKVVNNSIKPCVETGTFFWVVFF